MKVLLFIILSFCFINLYSQNIIDVRSMSMGNTSVSSSYNLDAFNQNPANILNNRLNGNAMIYFNVATNVGVLTSSNYLSVDFYNDYFSKDDNGNTRYLNDNDKATILNEASDQITNISASVKLLSFILNTKNTGTFGLSLDERSNGNFIPSKDFLELGLYGNEVGRTYNLSENTLNEYWIRELNLSYANKINLKNNKTFESISYGVSVKPQFGIYYFRTESNNLSIYTDDTNAVHSSGQVKFLYSGLSDNNDFQYSAGNCGFGLGFDAGVNARLKNISRNGYVNVGLSITDIGYLTWSKNTNTYFNDGTYIITDITKQSQIDSLKDIIKSTKTPVPEFTTGLPAVVRLGVSYKLTDRPSKKDSVNFERATIALDYVQGLTDDIGGTTDPIIGIGAEYNISKVISPRIGFTFGGWQDFAMSLGIGINAGPVIIDLGTNNFLTIFNPSGVTDYSAGLNIKFKVH